MAEQTEETQDRFHDSFRRSSSIKAKVSRIPSEVPQTVILSVY